MLSELVNISSLVFEQSLLVSIYSQNFICALTSFTLSGLLLIGPQIQEIRLCFSMMMWWSWILELMLMVYHLYSMHLWFVQFVLIVYTVGRFYFGAIHFCFSWLLLSVMVYCLICRKYSRLCFYSCIQSYVRSTTWSLSWSNQYRYQGTVPSAMNTIVKLLGDWILLNLLLGFIWSFFFSFSFWSPWNGLWHCGSFFYDCCISEWKDGSNNWMET